jgi:hypothetical protein
MKEGSIKDLHRALSQLGADLLYAQEELKIVKVRGAPICNVPFQPVGGE